MSLRIPEAFDNVWELIGRSNKYIDETTPWILAKDEAKKERLGTVLYNLVRIIKNNFSIVFQHFFLYK